MSEKPEHDSTQAMLDLLKVIRDAEAEADRFKFRCVLFCIAGIVTAAALDIGGVW